MDIKRNETEKTLISVLLPVFRPRIEELATSVKSICEQTYSCFELLVLYEPVEKDGVQEFFSNLDDPRIQIVNTPPRYGLPKSLNMGLERAKGQYIARMDADDFSYPRRFEEQLAYMEAHPKIDILGATIQIMDSRRTEFNKRGKTPERRAARLLFENAGIAHPTAFMRKSFLRTNHIKYNEEIRGSEDYHLWVDAVIHGGSIDQLPNVLLDYRVSETQASAVLSDKMKEWDLQARMKLFDAIGEFSEEEHTLFALWNDIGRIYEADRYVSFIKKVSEENKKTGILDADSLRRELAYQYTVKALLLYKHEHDSSLLRKWKEAVTPRDRSYIFRETAALVYTAKMDKLKRRLSP